MEDPRDWDRIKKQACEYVARHGHDNAQIFTNNQCRYHKVSERLAHVQVWVSVDNDLPEVDW